MKRTLTQILTAVLLLVATTTYAQTPTQQSWQSGHRAQEYVQGVVTDSHGNIYTGWDVDGIYPLGDGLNIEDSAGQCVLTSYTCDGTYRWSKQFGLGSGAWGHPLTSTVSIYGIDSSGGIYVSGVMLGGDSYYVNDTFYIGDTTIATTQVYNTYIAKFDTSGNYEWVRVFVDTFSPLNQRLLDCLYADVLPNGNSYFVIILPPGNYADGAFTATYPEGDNVYILKYDKDGNFLNGTHLDMGYSVTRGSLYYLRCNRSPITGGYYFAGIVGEDVYADTLRLGDSVLTNGGGDTSANFQTIPYVAEFDSSGNFMWVTKGPNGEGFNTPIFSGAPAIDNLGNVYVTGQSPTGSGFGPFTFNNGLDTLHQIPILVKLSPTGIVLNAVSGNVSDNSVTSGTAVSFNNGVIGVSGIGFDFTWGNQSLDYSPNLVNVFLARFNAANLNIIDLQAIHATGIGSMFPPEVLNLTNDNTGNFYVTGTFPGALYLPHDTLYDQGAYFDGFVVKFGSDNCNCTVPSAHYTHNGLLSGGTVSFTYDGSTPVDSVVWNFGDGESGSGTSIDHNYTQEGSYTVCVTAYNDCGSNMYCETLQAGGDGIGAIPGFANINIYPNPATQKIIVEHAAAGTILDIYNIIGQQMLHTVLKGAKDVINVSNLSSGVYLMRFTDKKGRQGNSKFVKR